ncbi:bifunctional tetrahydrofolate synthase/dihydrofolate synthase [Gilvimarinus sp. SDUM040013]|uniref:Dihydrofolate synthase/folylpolyglutamate synthase n=1 Tax=Gilvimarinus gilvus TaxID=3058038 RepID=A0ABU4RXS8_9GAMM|nr:bifunctional tetrahydrofolate synthase/dihydrofolate synthase [Gilvimarinus sp. SDUM040013]MDO3386436.1 bifunctional tetrahydrofolate synthase/dihydrofolate synthase [Gilvimarinus sp. SDUM040013]MDX6849702.1 bifunctional tetrahydrofolate synthase/dihydrofolate synthase [Gilvimarinus sp. SDUM040013]
MKAQSLDEWLARIERAHPTEIDMGLDRIRQAAAGLALSHQAKVVTVAGTNGKGSCVAATSAILRAMGYRVGSYTSPHLNHYCERVKINGHPVSEQEMCQAFAAVDSARGAISLTYFEFGTLAALWLFNRKQVDVYVLEIGLGGRLDAVNIVDPDVAVITSVALDHQDWLGSDRETIGREKAGVLRAGKHAVCADSDPPQSVLDVAGALQVPLRRIEHDFDLSLTEKGCRFNSGSIEIDLPQVHLPLPSVAAAIEAVNLLVGLPEQPLLQRTLGHLHLPGRCQHVAKNGFNYLLDVAHNPAATQMLAAQIARNQTSGLHYIFAVMADKDIDGILDNLSELPGTWYLAQLDGNARAGAAQDIRALIDQRAWTVASEGTMAQCLYKVEAAAKKDDLIVVFGSFFTVAEALKILTPESIPAI